MFVFLFLILSFPFEKLILCLSPTHNELLETKISLNLLSTEPKSNVSFVEGIMLLNVVICELLTFNISSPSYTCNLLSGEIVPTPKLPEVIFKLS